MVYHSPETTAEAMTDDEAAEHRRNVERYGYLLTFLGDAEMRVHLQRLLNEAVDRLAVLERDRRS